MSENTLRLLETLVNESVRPFLFEHASKDVVGAYAESLRAALRPRWPEMRVSVAYPANPHGESSLPPAPHIELSLSPGDAIRMQEEGRLEIDQESISLVGKYGWGVRINLCPPSQFAPMSLNRGEPYGL